MRLPWKTGFSPCDEVRNVEQTLFDENGKAWSPRNSSKSHYGEIVTLKWGWPILITGFQPTDE